MTTGSRHKRAGRRKLAFFFPMASPGGPVGYAAIGAGAEYERWDELPVESFDVSSVAGAWASLNGGSLWPAVPPEGTLRWRGSFMGSRDEVDAGRLRGRSAHLSILLLASAWRRGRLAGPGDQDVLRVWASGELDGEGRLLPVDQLEHKLRIFLEHWSCHPGPAVFIAPAATRSTISPERFRTHQPLEELRFDPRRLPELPDDKPVLLWVNRADVGALVRWLCGPARKAPSRRLLWCALALGLLLAVAAWALTGRLSSGSPDRQIVLPSPLKGARIALRVAHSWRIDDSLAGTLAWLKIDGDYLTWREPLSNYRQSTDNGCVPGFMLPGDVELRYALGPREVYVAAFGDPSKLLSVLAPPRRFGFPRIDSPEKLARLVFFRQQAFDPGHTLLAKVLLEQVQRLRKASVIQGEPGSAEDLLTGRPELFHDFRAPVHLVYQAVGCCGPDSNCLDSNLLNDVCPQPSAASAGSMSRSFKLYYVNPSNSYIALFFGGDRHNSAHVVLGGKTIAGCEGPHSRRTFLTDTYPDQVALHAERSWSQVYSEFSMAVVANGISVSDPAQEPPVGLAAVGPPVLAEIQPGWTAPPVFALDAHFDREIDPFRDVYKKGVSIERRRLRLERTAPEGCASVEAVLPAGIHGNWTLSFSGALLTEQSILAVCTEDRAWKNMNCVTLNNSTENGQQPGLHLLCNTHCAGQGIKTGQVLISHEFDPPAGRPYRIQLSNDERGLRLVLNGMELGRSSGPCAVRKFDLVRIDGFQCGNPGHGGFVDDVVVFSQKHRPLPEGQ